MEFMKKKTNIQKDMRNFNARHKRSPEYKKLKEEVDREKRISEICAEMRKKCSKLSESQRDALLAQAMDTIEGRTGHKL